MIDARPEARPNEYGRSEQIDPGKWELDPERYLDKVYHELLGEVEDEEGKWSRDPKRLRVMNEYGASEFITEVTSRVSIHMQMSELKDEDINEISSRAAEIYSGKLTDNWREWEITPTESSLESIGQRMFDILFITLKIAREGGMKHHREKKSNPMMGMPKEQQENFGI